MVERIASPVVGQDFFEFWAQSLLLYAADLWNVDTKVAEA